MANNAQNTNETQEQAPEVVVRRSKYTAKMFEEQSGSGRQLVELADKAVIFVPSWVKPGDEIKYTAHKKGEPYFDKEGNELGKYAADYNKFFAAIVESAKDVAIAVAVAVAKVNSSDI